MGLSLEAEDNLRKWLCSEAPADGQLKTSMAAGDPLGSRKQSAEAVAWGGGQQVWSLGSL